MAFLPFSDYSNTSTTILDTANSAAADTSLASDLPTAVKAGYAAQRKLLLKNLASRDAASLEIVWADPSILVALVKPLSRGSIQITTMDPFTQPAVEWRALSDPVDKAIMVAGVEFERAILEQASMQELGPTETYPGPDTEAETHVQKTAGTIWHPVGTCPMLPKAYGGIVDTNLMVYGASNLRIVDASIMPTIPATHTSSTVYAIAEKAAAIIKNAM